MSQGDVPHVCADCQTPLLITPASGAGWRFGVCMTISVLICSGGLISGEWPTAVVGLVLIAVCLLTLVVARWVARRCPCCGGRRLLPSDSPAGRKLSQ